MSPGNLSAPEPQTTSPLTFVLLKDFSPKEELSEVRTATQCEVSEPEHAEENVHTWGDPMWVLEPKQSESGVRVR